MTERELEALVGRAVRSQMLGHVLYAERALRDVAFDLQRHALPGDFADGGEGVELPQPVAAQWRQRLEDAAKVAVLVPAGLMGLRVLGSLPDADIRLLGIGNHRFFLFHSALTLWAFKWLYDRYCETSLAGEDPVRRLTRKAAGVALAGGAVGVGVHLLVDVFEPKAVIFPFFGSLVDGTLVDDRVWLLGHSVWAFQVARDLLVVSLGPDFQRVVSWVRETFVEPLFTPRHGAASGDAGAPRGGR